MFRINVRLNGSYLWIFLISIFLLYGCGSHHKKSTLPEKTAEINKSQTLPETPPLSKVEEAIQQAQSHYQAGLEHYRNQRWDLASKEFELSLKALLDADNNPESHKKLEDTYEELSLKIHLIQDQANNSKSAQTSTPNGLENNTSKPNTQTSASLSSNSSSSTVNQNPPLIFNTPIEIDEKIQEWINIYSRKKEDSNFLRGLERSTRYLPMIRKIFSSYGLPADLAYIPLIESSFSTEAVSPSGAVGMWQFVRSTARNYGLRVDKRVDERKDPVKSTHAAARYLKDLYRMLGSWDLVIAAYNSGEYKIHNAIGRYRTRDFEELSSTGYLGAETQNYVPMLKAAIIIASDPGKYGLNPVYESPLVYTEPSLPEKNPPVKTFTAAPSRLKSSSNKELLATIHFSDEKELNTTSTSGSAQTLTAISQPGTDEFGYEKPIQPSGRKREFVTYQIQKGDDLRKVAAKFKVTMTQLIVWNKLNTANLTPNEELKIWYDKLSKPSEGRASSGSKRTWMKGTRKLSKSSYYPAKKTVSTRSQPPKKAKIIYSVKKGDNLWEVSQNFNVDLNLLRKWNKLSPREQLMPGDKLIIHLNQPIN
jgi:membrane-bound lytic murein transglycosylase D